MLTGVQRLCSCWCIDFVQTPEPTLHLALRSSMVGRAGQVPGRHCTECEGLRLSKCGTPGRDGECQAMRTSRAARAAACRLMADRTPCSDGPLSPPRQAPAPPLIRARVCVRLGVSFGSPPDEPWAANVLPAPSLPLLPASGCRASHKQMCRQMRSGRWLSFDVTHQGKEVAVPRAGSELLYAAASRCSCCSAVVTSSRCCCASSFSCRSMWASSAAALSLLHHQKGAMSCQMQASFQPFLL